VNAGAIDQISRVNENDNDTELRLIVASMVDGETISTVTKCATEFFIIATQRT